MTGRDWVLGIDFGTSNTAAAHISPVSGSVEAVALSHNRTTMSSAVFVDTPDRISVGDVATDRAESNPSAYMPSPKRTVGQGQVTVNGFTLPASAPIAAVLSSVITRATSTHGGSAPTELVLTHPEAWSPREIQVLLDAAAQLGLDAAHVTTVSEPRAAAHYYSRAAALTPGTKIAVFDFGGGTLDTAVLEANDQGTFDIIAARGDNGLGGKNLDARVRRWVDDQLDGRDPDLLEFMRSRAPLDVRYALDDSIRRAKELLSEAPSATITVTGDGRSEKFQITRDEFEELIEPVLDKAVELARATLLDARITDPSQLEALYLTGGSSRIPIVHERLKPLGPIATLDDPKTVVAQGALAAAAPIVRGLFPSSAPPAATRTSPGSSERPAAYTPPASPPYSGEGPGHTEPLRTPHYPQPPQYRQPPQHPGAPQYPGPPHSAPANAADTGGSGRKKWPLAAGAAGVVLLVAAVAAALTLGGDTGTADPAAVAAGTPDTSAEADPAAGSGGSDPTVAQTTKEGVVAALPTALRNDIDPAECRTSGETDSGGLQIQCDIADGSALTAGLTDGSYSGVIITADLADAKKEVVRIRQGYGQNSTAADNITVENVARTAAARISGPSPVSGKYDLTYASNSTGVTVSFGETTSVENAKTFLSRAGLLS